MAEAGAAVAYAAKNLVESAALLAKGVYDPTLPLKATLQPIKDVEVPQAYQTISVIKGRAYAFGGKTLSKSGGEELTDSDMHVIILPASGVESTDYRRIGATEGAPPKRWGHSAAVVDDRIYVFGGSGQDDGEPMDEQGRVWVFNTATNAWYALDPHPESKRPEPRSQHASAASEHPRPTQRPTGEGVAPQMPIDPAKEVPEPPAPDTYGTIIVQGGKAKSGEQLHDIWAFDISSRTWAELPSLPSPMSGSSSLAMTDKRIYAFARGQTSYMDLTPGTFDDRAGEGELGLTPLGPWCKLSSSATSDEEETSHPGDREGATLVPVTTGQGRNYLLLLGGQTPLGQPLEDIWALQLKPEGMTAASFKDAARQAIRKDTGEMVWEEVKYYDSEGVMIQESQPGRGTGRRKGMAVAKGTEVDGASVVAWGGVGDDGRVRGDGVMVIVDR
ncbi:galactose oxidase [Hortaea werneckii]|uniref:Galactose oxidase n=1 Tax=Hortaea werneckii TaxID=91943 RepID=A0A3M7E470_HORWE|nr:galactose oxidase [Hortaea werneckii]KAI7564880.1 galactose oxidase [Hortaea werneckii]KAI7615072.1 galactose oxidase [Hortaea werneckii]KAI7625610.1 galactose oxidase [Hortaea werneckii]KAI7681442.1 galactose oxidase [Hortaea werneckii]